MYELRVFIIIKSNGNNFTSGDAFTQENQCYCIIIMHVHKLLITTWCEKYKKSVYIL